MARLGLIEKSLSQELKETTINNLGEEKDGMEKCRKKNQLQA